MASALQRIILIAFFSLVGTYTISAHETAIPIWMSDLQANSVSDVFTHLLHLHRKSPYQSFEATQVEDHYVANSRYFSGGPRSDIFSFGVYQLIALRKYAEQNSLGTLENYKFETALNQWAKDEEIRYGQKEALADALYEAQDDTLSILVSSLSESERSVLFTYWLNESGNRQDGAWRLRQRRLNIQKLYSVLGAQSGAFIDYAIAVLESEEFAKKNMYAAGSPRESDLVGKNRRGDKPYFHSIETFRELARGALIIALKNDPSLSGEKAKAIKELLSKEYSLHLAMPKNGSQALTALIRTRATRFFNQNPELNSKVPFTTLIYEKCRLWVRNLGFKSPKGAF